MTVTIRVDPRELAGQMKQMIDALNERELTSIIFRASKAIEDEAKKNLQEHKRTGLLAKFLVRHRGRHIPRLAQVAIGIKKGSEKRTIQLPRSFRKRLRAALGQEVSLDITPHKYAHLLELGFLHALTGRRIAGVKFMERAFRAKADEVGNKIAAAIVRLIARKAGQ